jgi:TolA-binding protein
VYSYLALALVIVALGILARVAVVLLGRLGALSARAGDLQARAAEAQQLQTRIAQLNDRVAELQHNLTVVRSTSD